MCNIGMTCDVCGRTVQGCTFVNGMKFCAKCYQETFGEKVNQCNHCSFKSVNDMSAEKIENLEQENKILKEQNERVLEKLELIIKSNQDLEQELEIYKRALKLACGLFY